MLTQREARLWVTHAPSFFVIVFCYHVSAASGANDGSWQVAVRKYSRKERTKAAETENKGGKEKWMEWVRYGEIRAHQFFLYRDMKQRSSYVSVCFSPSQSALSSWTHIYPPPHLHLFASSVEFTELVYNRIKHTCTWLAALYIMYWTQIYFSLQTFPYTYNTIESASTSDSCFSLVVNPAELLLC